MLISVKAGCLESENWHGNTLGIPNLPKTLVNDSTVRMMNAIEPWSGKKNATSRAKGSEGKHVEGMLGLGLRLW